MNEIITPKIDIRPMTKNGLGGYRPQTQSINRNVKDKAYWLGTLQEIGQLDDEKSTLEEQAQTFISTKNWANKKAAELNDLQTRLTDGNIVLEKSNQGLEAADINYESEIIALENVKEQDSLTTIFEDRKRSEDHLLKVEKQIDAELNQTQHLLTGMTSSEREAFLHQQQLFMTVCNEIENIEVEVQECKKHETRLENDLQHDLERIELVPLYADLGKLKEKQKHYEAEQKHRLTPEEEKDKLLKQFKMDNESMQRMDRQMQFVEDRMNKFGEQLIQLEADMDESNLSKLKGLKEAETKFENFLTTVPKMTEEECGQLAEKEHRIKQYLQEFSQIDEYVQNFSNLRRLDISEVQTELSEKCVELDNSKLTVEHLLTDRRNLERQADKFSKMESKLKLEALNLKKSLETMSQSLRQYSDVESLKREESQKTSELEGVRLLYDDELSELKMINTEIGRQIFHNDSELLNSTDHEAITNLERRWVNIGQGNEAIQQYIKSKENNCDGLQAMARQQVTDYNLFLLQQYDQPILVKK